MLSVLVITVVGGILLGLLLDQPIFGQGIVRILVISPFFVMPTVAALVWKNMMMDPNYGIFAWIATRLRLCAGRPGSQNYPLFSVIIIVSWQWLPFATLILLTALQSLDEEQKEAAGMDGANFVRLFFYIILPHIARAITVVILIETIFLLSVFAEIWSPPAAARATPRPISPSSSTTRPCSTTTSAALRRAASSRSFSPTSSRSSWCASSARTSMRELS